MNRHFGYLLAALFLLLIQLTFLPYVAIKQATPDLLLLFVIAVAVREGRISGVIWGFAIGLMWDVFFTDYIGLSALTKSLIAFWAGSYATFKDRFQAKERLLLFLVLPVAHDIIYYFFFTYGQSNSLSYFLLRLVLLKATYTAAFGYMISGLRSEMFRPQVARLRNE